MSSVIDRVRDKARRRAHRMVFDYIDGGADDVVTLRRNCDAFAEWDLAFRVLGGIEQVDTSTSILGQAMRYPFFFSSAAGNRLFHTQGESAVCKVAGEFGIPYSLSTLASTSIEDIAGLTCAPKFFQLYVWKDRGLLREMIERARAAGFCAMLLTVDFPITGNRERDIANGFTIPPRIGLRQAIEAARHPAWTWDYLTKPPIRYANLSGTTSATTLNKFVSEQLYCAFSWRDTEWLLGEWNGPCAIKGVVRADDAARAVETGFDCIIVSNHGGRQLDSSLPAIRALPAIAERIGNDAEIVLDGGIRRGTDILKAIALGAKCVSFARPYLYGLAANGIDGVREVTTFMADSLRRDMMLAGVQTVSDITLDMVRSTTGRSQREPDRS
jgi:L-lactate dehydrogenase (cytochrome)